MLNMAFCPIILNSQIHTEYTVNANDKSIFEMFSGVFVRCTDNTHQSNVCIVLIVVTLDTDCNSSVV